ncbi:hypothetical protein CEE44_05015 [Candidatus Woesearchaeota archaeon B3_Woes]|nr:MAG: hypothetical protein CEE44_05015 [Candidatus Woesearchaeota archaeon B3_Woes]
MKKDKELLKIEWENHKVYTFGSLSASLIIAFGVLSNLNQLKENLISLSLLVLSFVVFMIAFFVSLKAMGSTYKELRNVIINRKPKKNKPRKKNF